MPVFYAFGGMLAIVAGLIAVPTIAFIILALFEGFPRIRLGQVAGIVAIVAWFFGLFGAPGPGYEEMYLFWSVVGLLLTFFGLWKREMRLLMSRRDDEFPGRIDKACWFVILTLFAPAGVWIFRSYRRSRWPETSGAGRWESPPGKPRSNPWDDDEADAPSPARAGVE